MIGPVLLGVATFFLWAAPTARTERLRWLYIGCASVSLLIYVAIHAYA